MALPNILYLHTHDTGRWIEPYGFSAAMPNLMRLAKEGVLFRQAFCTAPTCSPSRASLLTGQSPHAAGMLGLAHRGWALTHPERHLANYLQGHGYQTYLCGLQHVMPRARVGELGYSYINPNGSPNADSVAVGILRERKNTPLAERAPFFMDVGVAEPHRQGMGFGENDGLADDRYVTVPPGLPDIPIVRRDIADYVAAVQHADYRLGRVMAALRECGEEDNTLIIYTTDHGPAFPGYKCNLTDQGLGVALMVRGFGFRDGRVQDSLVSHLDLFPTICEVAGLPQPGWLEGKSLCVLNEGQEEVRNAVFGEVTFHASWEPMRAVRTRRWKYIRRFLTGDSAPAVISHCDDSPTKRWSLANGGFQRVAKEELFDLLLDPQETMNLAQRCEHADTLHDMQGRLDEWMAATADPLLQEHYAVPPEIIVNPPGGMPVGKTIPEGREYYPDYDPACWPVNRSSE